MKRYEGMFLFDSAAMHQWTEIEAEVRRLCDRIEAELLVCIKFDDRRLAFEIKGRKRGTYVLTYFDADPNRIGELERDVQLNEVVLRVLVLRAETITEARLAELKALPTDQPLQPLSGDGRRGDGEPYRGRFNSSARPRAAEKKPAGADQPAEQATAKPATESVPAPAGEPAPSSAGVATIETPSATTTAGTAETAVESGPEPAPEAPPTAEASESKPADE